jgi:lipopolysaccharide export system permease protein
MLFRRSLLNELISTAIGAFLVLFGIVIAQRTGYLIKLAAKGSLPNDAITVILGFTMIRFLPMLLSVSIFLSILMTLSRWYRDSEMIIWLSSGQSIKSLIRPILTFCAPVILAILLLSLFITPWANNKVEDYRVLLESRDELAAISPGVFKEASHAERVFFVESFDELGNVVKNIFVQSVQHQKLGIIVAAEGSRLKEKNGDNFLVMQNGRRYQGKPGTPEYSVTEFERYAIRIEPTEIIPKPPSAQSKSSFSLFKEKNNTHTAELEWRFAMPISALILALFAIPLSALDPRAGKSANFILAIIIYVIYSNLISIVQAWIAQGKINALIGLWPVHLFFLAIALYMFKRNLEQKPLIPDLFAQFKKNRGHKKASRPIPPSKKKYENSF